MYKGIYKENNYRLIIIKQLQLDEETNYNYWCLAHKRAILWEKNVYVIYEKNDSDQPVNSHSLIHAIVIR